MQKNKLITILILTTFLFITGCSSEKIELQSEPSIIDVKVNEYGYDSSKKAIRSLFEGYDISDRKTISSCFNEQVDNTDTINKILADSIEVSNDTTLCIDEIDINEIQPEEQINVKKLGYTSFDNIKYFEVIIPSIKNTYEKVYEFNQYYTVSTISILDRWYICTINKNIEQSDETTIELESESESESELKSEPIIESTLESEIETITVSEVEPTIEQETESEVEDTINN